ncbi:beta-1,3-galactosyltransferase 6 [Battus philenor]|uniref:beta-1,3-galactosyltransferase 6 n=1 Tax=Battus philenor TaxID=42288 RepID=UPI0035CF80BE
MFTVYLRKYKSMILLSVFFFYLGCCLTISLTRIECATTPSTNKLLKNQDEDLSTAKYIVLIISSPNNELKRDAIRATWGNLHNNIFMDDGELIYKWNNTWVSKQSRLNIVKLYFVVGTLGLSRAKAEKLRNEQRRTKDILQLHHVEDTYKNLSFKILNALDWVSKNLKQMEYLIKCDDDSFVRIDLIVRDLAAYAPSMNAPAISQFISVKENLPLYKGLYLGYFNGHAKVYLKGKWQEKSWFLCDNYLPYALGGGYVISSSIVNYIARNMDFLSYYNSEDVSMGVWTASLNAINRVHDIRFDTEWKSRGCDENMLVRHKQTPSDMFQMYRTLVESHGEKLCKTEDLKRKTYLYDWNVLPSMCCNNS